MKKLIFLFALTLTMFKVSAQCNDRPIVNDFTPQTGFIGSTVTITGANFSATPSENQVFFGATEATVVSSSFGTLVVRVPEGSTTALISVKNQCNLSAYSKTHFNGVFCPTPLTNTSYQNTAQELTVSYGAYNMVSQDMDNDGKPDMVIAGLNGGLSIARNNSTPGNINFSAYNFASNTRTIAVADFDGDGFKDLATNYNILRNTSSGPGNFGLAVAISNSSSVSDYQIGAGDFNNDGKIDIIGEFSGSIWVAFNTSTGVGNFSFTSRQLVASGVGNCTGIQIADVDGDGKADFLGSQGNNNRAVSIRNTTANGSSTPSFEAPEYWSSGGSYPYRAMIADFDKDGKIDFTSCNFSGNANVAIWRNTSIVGNISFATTINLPAPGSNYRIGVGDVDGDGYPDVVTKSSGTNVFSVYKNTTNSTGNVTFNTRLDYTSSSRAEVSGLAIGDLDGDFVPDIATSGISSRTIRFHRNTGGQNDTTPPTVVCQNITVALSPSGTVSITPDMIDNGSGDACGIESLTLSLSDFTCADIGENIVTLTATDGAGNQSSCSATVNVQPAAIIVAGQSTVCQGETVEMNANDGDSYQWKKDGTNIFGATNQNYIATSTGDYTVVVTNAGGCSGESLITPVVVNENPTVDISPSGNAFLCPPNGTTTLTATQSSIYQWMKEGVDIPNATQQSYEATSVGSYNVRVIDLFGCSAVSEPTTITANPAEIEVSGNGNFGNVFPDQDYTQTITISNTGTGNLDITNLSIIGADAGSFTLAGFASPGTISPGGTSTVDVIFNAPNITTYSAILSFNSNDCDEEFFSIPLTAEITCVAAGFSIVPANVLANTDEELCNAVVNYNVEFTGNPTSTLTYIFSGATTASDSGSGSGSVFNIGTTTVTMTVENPCGTETETFDVVVTDNQIPTVLTQDIAVDLDANGNASITAAMINNSSFDNCGIASYTLDIDTFNCSNVGDNTVNLTVTDVNGNNASSSANVTVSDATSPTVVTQNISVDLANGMATITANDIDGGTFDNCNFTLSIDRTDFSCEDIGDHTVTLTAADASGNTSSDTATVSITGDIPSVNIDNFTTVNTQNSNTVYLGYGPQSVTLNTNTNGGSGFTYNWTSNTGEIIDNVANPEVSPTISSIYTVIVTNSNGCISEAASIEVCVIDARAFDKKGRYKGKVNICHHTNGKKGTKHVNISISQNAVASHLQHGLGTDHPDSLGSCGAVCVDNTNAKAFGKTEVTSLSLIDNLYIYPNPSNGIFDVRLTTIGSDTNVLLFDSTGKLIERKFFNSEESAENIITIGNHQLASGIYILKIITKNESVSKKLMVSKN